MEQTNNVILFPAARYQQYSPDANPNAKPSPTTGSPLSVEEIDKKIQQNIHYHIQKTIGFLVPNLFNQMHVAGFTPDGEDDFTIKEGAFIVEAIRSYMFSFYEMKHPFQKIVDKVFIQEENDGKDVLTISKNIMVTLGE
jgi:hypothetical protein